MSVPALRRARTRDVALALLLVSSFPFTLSAQTPGNISGRITTDDGRALFGARVSIASPSRVAITDANGRYVLRAVAAGRYDVQVSALGYQAQHTSVAVTAHATTTADVALARGSLMLSSVITSATRAPIEATRVAATVNVLTPEQILASPARETQDLLREIPGVELPRTSSVVGGSAQIVSIRGVDEGRTVVTADGVPLGDAWGEWIDWSRLPKGLVDRVEVVEGGTSSLYGNGGIGGSIAFFTRPLAPGAARLTTEGGSRDMRHLFAAAGVPLYGALTAMVSGDYGDGGGYQLISPANDGPVDHASTSVRRNGQLRVEYAPSASFSTFATVHTFSDDRDLGTALARTTRAALDGSLGINWGTAPTGALTIRAWGSQQDEDQYTSTISAVSGVARSKEVKAAWLHIPTHDWGAGLQWSRQHVAFLRTLTVGADYRTMNGFTNETDYSATTGAQTAFLHSGGEQVLSGAFVQTEISPVSPVSIELSARVDHWGNNNGIANVTPATGTPTSTSYENRSRDAFSPRAGIRWQVTGPLALHAAAYQAFRAPNLAELYRRFNSGSTQSLPNPALKPEFGTGYESGFDFQPTHWLQLKGTAYNVDMRDFNSFVTISTGVRQRQNVQQSRARGGEAFLALRPMPALYLTASLNYVDAKVVSGPTGTRVGQRVGRVPVQRQNVRATYTSPVVGTLTLAARHEGVTTTLQGVPLAPYTLMDALYRREIVRSVAGFVSIENVADTDYQVALTSLLNGVASLGMPRTVRVGLDIARF